jgi:predicted nucleotidyltransferase
MSNFFSAALLDVCYLIGIEYICNMQTAVQNKQTLISLLKANGHKLRLYGVSDLSLFGSFATGKFTPDSDVDFLVDFDPGQKSYDNFMDLSFFLEDLLGRKVELVTPQSLSKYIGPHILKQAEHVAI